MYSKEEIYEFIGEYTNGNSEVLNHFYHVLSDIQEVMLNNRYPSKFVECCVKKDWTRAALIGDAWNKEALTGIKPNQKIDKSNVPIDKDSLIIEWVRRVRRIKNLETICNIE